MKQKLKWAPVLVWEDNIFWTCHLDLEGPGLHVLLELCLIILAEFIKQKL